MKDIRKLLLFTITFFAIPVLSMKREEAPAQLPFEKQFPKFLKYYEKLMEPGSLLHEEIQRFKKYDLDHPEQFLKKMREELHYSHPLDYLKELQLFANVILLQHTLMKLFASYVYLRAYRSFNYQRILQLSELIDPYAFEKVKVGLAIQHHKISPKFANIILVYPAIFELNKFANQNTRNIIYRLILSNDKELNLWGEFLILNQASLFTKKMLEEREQHFINFFYMHALPENKALIYSIEKIIYENIPFLREALLSQSIYSEKTKTITKKAEQKKSEIGITSIFEDWVKKNQELLAVYIRIWPEYQKLYELIRKEMTDVIKEQISKDKSLARVLLNFHQVLYKDNYSLLPTILPPNLSPFKNPRDYIILNALDDELEKTYEQWKQEGSSEIGQAITAKKIKRKPKKKSPPRIARQEQPVAQVVTEAKEEEQIQEPQVQEPKILKEAPDGSYILEGDETNQRITIINPAHDTTEIIFKSSNPGAIKETIKPDYIKWVREWFDNPDQAIIDQGYSIAGSKKFTPENLYWKPIALHAFSQLVDEFIPIWGKKTEIERRKNPGQMDILITLPGMMIFNKDGKEELGVYAYLIDSRTGKWYHRMFEPQGSQKLIKDLLEKGYFSPDMKGYYDVAFPELPKR